MSSIIVMETEQIQTLERNLYKYSCLRINDNKPRRCESFNYGIHIKGLLTLIYFLSHHNLLSMCHVSNTLLTGYDRHLIFIDLTLNSDHIFCLSQTAAPNA